MNVCAYVKDVGDSHCNRIVPSELQHHENVLTGFFIRKSKNAKYRVLSEK